jgi:hypothetical protein
MAARRDLHTRELFEVPSAPLPTEGSLNYQVEVCAAMSQVLKASPLTRYQVAARMSELLGVEISKYMLDSWTAESREAHRFPFEFAVAFEIATDSYALSELHARKRGARFLIGKENLLVELGRIGQARAALIEREKAIKNLLREEE